MPIPSLEKIHSPLAPPFPGKAVRASARRGLFLFDWMEKPWSSATLALFCAAAVVALAFLMDQREILRRSIARESAEIRWMVFLRPGADRGSLEESLKALPGVRSLRFISQDEAYEMVLRDSDLSQSLVLTGRNPFPASFEVQWNTPFLTSSFLSHQTEKVEAMESVDHVGYEQLRVERLDVLQRLSHSLNLLLTGGLWLTAFLFLFHLGRLVFFPKGAFPFRRLLSASVLGLLAGEAGFLASQRWTLFVYPEILAAGLLLSLLVALVREP